MRRQAGGTPVQHPSLTIKPESPGIMTRDIPFGLKAGMRLSDFPGKLEEVVPGLYRLPVPKPHPDFPSYLGFIGPESGLQWIKAIGKGTQTNSFGTALRGSFDEFAGRLAKVYGAGRLNDVLLEGALFDEPEDFMRALQRGERGLGMTWDKKSGATIAPPLASICLAASAIDDDSGFLVIEYTLDGYERARREIEVRQDDVL